MRRPVVGVLFGGCGEEHDVAVKSAQEVARHLHRSRWAPVYVGITRAGAWLLCDSPDAGWEQAGRRALLAPDRTVGGLVVDGRTIPLDVVLPVLHGRFGEDGSVQGLLELAGIPYVGCDVQSSALCMDKALTYAVVAGSGIATPAFRIVLPADDVDHDGLEYPVFVKPARSGSSFGVTRVDRPDALVAAVAEARRYDTKVLVEQSVTGSEVGCAVLGSGEDLVTGELDRITLSHGFFRIHQEDAPETGSENSTITVPADIPASSAALVRETAVRIYRALGCRGLARVDVFLTDDGRVVLNEVNTFPGLTSYSRYPRMMAAAGLPLGQVLDRLITLALAPGEPGEVR